MHIGLIKHFFSFIIFILLNLVYLTYFTSKQQQRVVEMVLIRRLISRFVARLQLKRNKRLKPINF